MTGPSVAIIATERWFAISNASAWWRSYPIAKERPSRLGSAITGRSRSSRAIVVACTVRRPRRHCLMPSRSPIAGTSSRTPAPPSSTPCANRCERSGPRSVRRRSARTCSPARRSSNTKATFVARRPHRLARLADRYGAERTMAALLAQLAGDCKQRTRGSGFEFLRSVLPGPWGATVG